MYSWLFSSLFFFFAFPATGVEVFSEEFVKRWRGFGPVCSDGQGLAKPLMEKSREALRTVPLCFDHLAYRFMVHTRPVPLYDAHL